MIAHSPPFIVIDACVLMSGILRRLLLRVAEQGVFQPVWTERIGTEWRRNAARLWQIPLETLQEQWEALQTRFPTALEHDTEIYEASLRYSDPKDFHVIAAGLARRARCGLQHAATVQIATWNLKDFNRSELRRQGIDAFTPDVLLARWFQEQPKVILSALALVPTDYVAFGRSAEPLAKILQRERLYRVNSLVARLMPDTR